MPEAETSLIGKFFEMIEKNPAASLAALLMFLVLALFGLYTRAITNHAKELGEERTKHSTALATLNSDRLLMAVEQAKLLERVIGALADLQELMNRVAREARELKRELSRAKGQKNEPPDNG